MLVPALFPYQASRFRTDLAVEGASSPDGMDDLTTGLAFVWRPQSTRLFAVENNASATGAVYGYTVNSLGQVLTSGSPITLASSASRQGIAFNATGTKLYTALTAGGTETYSLSTAYGGTATLDGTASLGLMASMHFNPAGTTFYYTKNTGSMFQRTLSTPFNLSTAGSETLTWSGGGWHDISRGGTRLLVSSGDTVTEYSGETPYDFGSFTATGESITISGAGFVVGVYRPDGEMLNIGVGKNIYTYNTVL